MSEIETIESLFEKAFKEFQNEEFEKALDLCDKSIKLGNKSLVVFLMRGRLLVQESKFLEAKEQYELLLENYPYEFNGWLELGNIQRKLGKEEDAIKSYEKAIDSRPEDERGYFAIVRVLEESGNFIKASNFLYRAFEKIENKPEKIMKLAHHLGQFRLEIGEYDRALEILRYSLEVAKRIKNDITIEDSAEILIDYADILMKLELNEQSFSCMQYASMSSSIKTLSRLAEVSFKYNLLEETREIIKKCINIEPENYALYDNLAAVYVKEWLLDEALLILEKGKNKNKKAEINNSLLSSIYGRIGDINNALIVLKECIENGDDHLRSSAAMTSLYSDTMTPQEVINFHTELFVDWGKNARSKDSFKNLRTANRQLKLGFVSSDFNGRHPVSIFMNPIFENIDKNKFHTTIYSSGASFDNDTQKVKKLVDVWKEMKHLTEAQFARMIEDDKIDILIDLSGHTGNNKLLYLAKRLAPVQVTFLGYPNSTGVPNIDWIIADKVIAPFGNEHLFSEKVARVDGTVFCYSPEEEFIIPQWDDEVINRPITFGTFNNIMKITPHTIRLWSEILKAVNNSKLLIKSPAFREEGAIKRYYKLFEEQGINPNRLELRESSPLNIMMSEYLDIDIALDPIPYNGGTTTLQAMWMGCPVITQEGGLFVSRMGASFMNAAGLSDWIAKNDEEYVQIAINMAKDRKALLELKRGLRGRLVQNDAWNIKKYTKNIEKLLEMFWAEECDRKRV